MTCCVGGVVCATCPIIASRSHMCMQFTSNINYYVLQSCSVYVVVQYHMECCMNNHNAVGSKAASC